MPDERASQEAKSRRVLARGGPEGNSVSCRLYARNHPEELMSDVAAETNHAKTKTADGVGPPLRTTWPAPCSDFVTSTKEILGSGAAKRHHYQILSMQRTWGIVPAMQ
jgi:hypothetical protein